MEDFTNFLHRAEQIAGMKFNTEQIAIARKEYDEMISLMDAEQSAMAYAAKKKRQAGFNVDADSNLTSDVLDVTDGTADDPHLAARIRRWAKRTSRDRYYGVKG